MAEIPAIVLLSGGMDSTVALFWAMQQSEFNPLDTLFMHYGQVAGQAEFMAAREVWTYAWRRYAPGRRGVLWNGHHEQSFVRSASILRGANQVDQYANVEEAVAKTASDQSYIPLRNHVLVSLAAHKVLADHHPNGPDNYAVIIGTRGRSGPGGFPDCTSEFVVAMTASLSQASGKNVKVYDPLNMLNVSRAGTIQLAREIPGCFDALKYTVSCFRGEVPGCGHCLPCLRRAQAFAEVGVADPAIPLAQPWFTSPPGGVPTL